MLVAIEFIITAIVILEGKIIKSWPIVALSFESVNKVLIHMEKDRSAEPNNIVPTPKARVDP
jgi:hypothetical protein